MFYLNKTVKNHLLGDIIIYLFMITISLIITTLLNINVQSQYIIGFLLAFGSIFLGEILLKRYFPHLVRTSSETNVELIILTIVVFFLGDIISKNTSFWIIITLYYLVYVIVTTLFEQSKLRKKNK